MPSSLRWKAALLLFMITFSVMTVLPSFQSVPDWWSKYLAPGGLRLGLDLQGGMHLVMKVNLQKAIENNLDLAAQDLKDALSEKKITVVRTASADKHQVVFTLPNTGTLDTVKQVIKDDFPELDTSIQADPGSFPRITLNLNDEKIPEEKKIIVRDTILCNFYTFNWMETF